jgi:hypothetical protein
MKLVIVLLLFSISNVMGQRLLLSVLTDKNQEVIDSVGYKKVHLDAKSLLDATNLLAERLHKAGFLESRVVENRKMNDSTFLFRLDLGKRTNFIDIYIGNHFEKLFDSKKDTIRLKYNAIEGFLESNLQKLERQGFGLSKLQLANIQKKKDFLMADLQIVSTQKRSFNDFVIKGYDKFPVGYKKSLQRKYQNQVFNQDNLKKINADIQKIRFVRQSKFPEILFTTDSTKVYVYLEKAKTNTFDGFIGFTNDEKGKLILNGYVDLALNNALNVGEKLAIYWKSDGRDQKTFNGGVEIPYIFNSPLAVKAQLNIFKQDSIFQNTKTAMDVGYYVNFRSKVYLGYQSTESNDIKNTNSGSISDFNNSYYTASYTILDYNNDDFLFPERTNFEFKIGTGKRESKRETDKQLFGSLFLNYHFYLTKKTAINLKSQNYYLQSDSYYVNELLRFGGINSIRGFNENSLQANVLASLMTEYQYIISPSLYLHSVLDYGYFQDKTSKTSGKMYGVGLGFGLQTKNGLLNFIYANGTMENQSGPSSNSIVQISLKTIF